MPETPTTDQNPSLEQLRDDAASIRSFASHVFNEAPDSTGSYTCGEIIEATQNINAGADRIERLEAENRSLSERLTAAIDNHKTHCKQWNTLESAYQAEAHNLSQKLDELASYIEFDDGHPYKDDATAIRLVNEARELT